RRRQAGAFSDTEKLRRTNLAAQRMFPTQIADTGDEPTGAQLVPTHVAKTNVAVGDGFAQLACEIQSREGAQLQRVAVKRDAARIGAARLGSGGPRVIQQGFGRGRIEAENRRAREGFEAELGAA